ncbi:MAG TPA: DUF4157 domain-containing protein, partial [Polyangiaceae bacterium]
MRKLPEPGPISGAPALDTTDSSCVFARLNTAQQGGVAIEAPVLERYESAFDRDFSRLRIHTDPKADGLAKDLGARAFTLGNHIFFKEGQYAPSSAGGEHLLAHELTHVVQGNGEPARIMRAPDPTQAARDRARASAQEADILTSPEYKKLGAESKWRVREIIARAAKAPPGDSIGQRHYYLTNLKLAITTAFEGTESGAVEYGCSDQAEKDNRKAVEEALEIEKQWMGAFSDLDELAVAEGTHKTRRRGQDGKIFTVDRSDPRNILVHMKVKLNGKPEEVKAIRSLEDAIEREVSMSTKGYHLDIEFVDRSGPDVFEFSVAFCQWANSGNWASGPQTLSHEVHHALGLDDRYDYIVSHATNPQMNVP